MSVARGISTVRSVSTASSSSSGSPLVATMTGSSTTGTPGNASSPSATASMMGPVASMPILMAPTSRSLATTAHLRQHELRRHGHDVVHAFVFWAVSAVMALAP